MVDEFKFRNGDRVKLLTTDWCDKAKGLNIGHLGTVNWGGKNLIEVKWDGIEAKCLMGERQLEKIDVSLKWDVAFPPDFGYEIEQPKAAGCSCEKRVVVNFGCGCAAGAAELAKERA